jgi:Rps23 Pro-64 3,4-dihydroxylase Tpa1-like proline 4-hydroxylase
MSRKSKRAKLEEEINCSPILENLFTTTKCDELKCAHDNSGPYTHSVLYPLCDDSFMRLVHSDALTNMTATFKETDLFKVFQTGDLATLSSSGPGASKMRHLLALRDAIYSERFRKLVGDVMGCDDLTEKVDCSANAYTHGCHLLCHDDVIGTRRISYIIYLTDPDCEWTAEDGGALELYPLEGDKNAQQGVPVPSPTNNLLPRFNSMALFRVQPGKSYHSVQEVYAKDKPRLSISGWFHGPTPPEGADGASLKQIMTMGDDARPFERFSNGSVDSETAGTTPSLSAEDMCELKKYVNPTYLTTEAMTQICEQFCSDSSIQLHGFIHDAIAAPLMNKMFAVDEIDKVGNGHCPPSYQVGLHPPSSWKVVGPPHKRRHLVYECTNDAGDGEIGDNCENVHGQLGQGLATLREKLFRSAAFARYCEKITTLRPTGYKDTIRRFRPGLDYTVAHYSGMTKVPRLDATLCFVDSREDGGNEEEEKEETKGKGRGEIKQQIGKAALWDSGDAGGFECYIAADDDEDAEAAAVYKSMGEESDDEGDQLLSVSPAANVLSLVMRNENIMRFVKYVSATAPSSRFDISAEFEFAVEEDDEEG